jgi:hypothetical protein
MGMNVHSHSLFFLLTVGYKNFVTRKTGNVGIQIKIAEVCYGNR